MVAVNGKASVMTGSGKLIEVQGTAERSPFTEADLVRLVGMAKSGIAKIIRLQANTLGVRNKSFF